MPLIDGMAGETQINDKTIDTIKGHISNLLETVNLSQQQALINLTLLKNANSNILSKYYWIVFIFLYAGVYLMQ